MRQEKNQESAQGAEQSKPGRRRPPLVLVGVLTTTARSWLSSIIPMDTFVDPVFFILVLWQHLTLKAISSFLLNMLFLCHNTKKQYWFFLLSLCSVSLCFSASFFLSPLKISASFRSLPLPTSHSTPPSYINHFYRLQILSLTTSAESLLPYKSTFTGSRNQDWISLGAIIQPKTHDVF